MGVKTHDQLLAAGQQTVESVEELFLRSRLGRQEMQIIHQEEVALAEILPESAQLAQSHRLDKSGGEFLRGGIANMEIGILLAHARINVLQEVRFARPDRAVDHERDRALAGRLHEANGGCLTAAMARPTT